MQAQAYAHDGGRKSRPAVRHAPDTTAEAYHEHTHRHGKRAEEFGVVIKL
jgi:hypothetical protein